MLKQFLAFGSTPNEAGSSLRATSPSIQLTAATVPGSGVTVTTVGAPSSPGDVVYNTTPEPWNPTPCTPK
jgi:hypothetical protein